MNVNSMYVWAGQGQGLGAWGGGWGFTVQLLPQSPVTYISMPSLKVKMVVVLEVAEPCFRSPMLSYRFSPGSSRALAGRCCNLGFCCVGGGGGGCCCCKGCWPFFLLGRRVAQVLGGLSLFQAPPPSRFS